MAKSELVYEFLGSQNLNTTPIDITGLQGNTYDYKLVMFGDAVNNANEIRLTSNNDTTSNYRWYRMAARAALAFANVDDSISHVYLGNCKNKPTLLVCDITGELGDERLIKSFAALADSASATELAKVSGYWKDTITEVQSLQLFTSNSVSNNYHIMLYRVPKAANQGNWEKVDELTWAAETAEKSFTGLDGNRDKKYKVVWSGDDEPRISINADQSVNYTVQELRNENGTIKSAPRSQSWLALDGIDASIIINAVSGQKRLCIGSASKGSGGAVDQGERATWWGNTLNTLNTIELNIDNRTLVGTATLYRMKGNGETDGSLPWELIEEVDVSGDFSSGHTFSNLTGNSEKLFRVEFLGTTLANLQCRMNGDVAANQHITQRLRGESSSTSALQTITSSLLVSQTGSTGATFDMVIYPKTGSQRPALSGYSSGENNISRNAHWYVNTVDEITSILIDASSTATVTGKLKLWRLK